RGPRRPPHLPGAGQAEGDRRAAAGGARDRDAAARAPAQGATDREPEADTGRARRAGTAATMEALEDERHLLGHDAWAGVGNLDDGIAAIDVDIDGDPTAGPAELHGVV